MSLSVSSNWANTHSCIYICISIDYVFLLNNAELVLRIITWHHSYAHCLRILHYDIWCVTHMKESAWRELKHQGQHGFVMIWRKCLLILRMKRHSDICYSMISKLLVNPLHIYFNDSNKPDSFIRIIRPRQDIVSLGYNWMVRKF